MSRKVQLEKKLGNFCCKLFYLQASFDNKIAARKYDCYKLKVFSHRRQSVKEAKTLGIFTGYFEGFVFLFV